MPNEWLKDAAPWIVAVIAPVTAYWATRRKTQVEADASLRSDLRETERYLRQQLREVESDNKSLRTENLELRQANISLKAEFEDFKRDTSALIQDLRTDLDAGRAERERLTLLVQELREQVER